MRTQLAFRITPSDVRFTSFTTEVTKHAKTDPCVWPWASVHSLPVFGAAQRRASKGGARNAKGVN